MATTADYRAAVSLSAISYLYLSELEGKFSQSRVSDTGSQVNDEVAAQPLCQHFVSKSPGSRIAVNLGDPTFVGCNAVADDGRRANVFANFEIGSRQIDLLVALDDVALVIEAKGSNRRVMRAPCRARPGRARCARLDVLSR